MDPYVLTEGFPVRPGAALSYAALKETGKWTMGVIQAGSADKDASKKLTINYSRAKFWPHNFGKPDGSCDQPFGYMEDSHNPPNQYKVATCQNNRAILRLVIGPMPVFNKAVLPQGDDGETTKPQFSLDRLQMAELNDVRVNVKTEYMCSLGDLKAISGLDAQGIVYPPAPKLTHTFQTPTVGIIPHYEHTTGVTVVPSQVVP